MQLRIKTTTGLVSIEVSDDGTVLDLKSALAERLGGSDPGLLRLIFKGRVLKDSSMLSEYGEFLILFLEKPLSKTKNKITSRLLQGL